MMINLKKKLCAYTNYIYYCFVNGRSTYFVFNLQLVSDERHSESSLSLAPKGSARRFKALGFSVTVFGICLPRNAGVLSGGTGCGAIRVYEDPVDVLRHTDGIGGRR